ncbi:hypothetical protein ACO22_04383 [Paracoccidioides brasiliensis]|uniref:Uncharacterized protein n=1 Tax=Paracoccidioides brasiliensis TaxID=121759 RepID=A0A1D2JDD2_PARBR|nr:hypothetical protein ACO22_04383 [Paracoccidioides brasiliensis]
MKAEREEKKRDDREKWDKIDGTKADILSKSPYSNPAYSKRHLRFNNQAGGSRSEIDQIDRSKNQTANGRERPFDRFERVHIPNC